MATTTQDRAPDARRHFRFHAPHAHLAPAFGEGASDGTRLRLWYDADQVEALSSEREALWARVGAAAFLTTDEKRAAIGYGPLEGGEGMGPDGA